jgi:hypothetical protein
MKNSVLLENYYLPGDLERQIGAFVDYYYNQRCNESLNNVTPADVYFGRGKAVLREREKSKNGQSNNAACNIKNKPHNQSHKRARASNAQAALMSHFI